MHSLKPTKIGFSPFKRRNTRLNQNSGDLTAKDHIYPEDDTNIKSSYQRANTGKSESNPSTIAKLGVVSILL